MHLCQEACSGPGEVHAMTTAADGSRCPQRLVIHLEEKKGMPGTRHWLSPATTWKDGFRGALKRPTILLGEVERTQADL